MTAYFEIDFLSVGERQSGDAIALRYGRDGNTFVHVVDGGFQDDGPHVMAHLRKYYGGRDVSHVVLTHPDSDHAGGLRSVLEECAVAPGGGLWMLRPWLYAAELLDHFARFTTVSGLENALREAYPNVAALEEIARRRRIPIYEPFQGATIGEFTVLAPSKARYLRLIVDSEKTPKEAARAASMGLLKALQFAAAKVVHYAKAAWGVEVFSTEPTNAENEMSVVQYAILCDTKILLTGDVGREGLSEAADFAPFIGLQLPGINRFDVPHHGSRRNGHFDLVLGMGALRPAFLNRHLGGQNTIHRAFAAQVDLFVEQLGPRLPQQLPEGQGLFHALISANPDDMDHPRRAVVRGLMHRGADVFQTTGKRGAYLRTFKNARNVSTEVLDRWLGPRLPQQLPEGQGLFHALISANPDDMDHPRRAVVRGLMHRGADVFQTTGKRGAYLRTFKNAPRREGEVPAKRLPYPEDQEEE